MTKPIDGTTPSGREPEATTGTQELSWQSAMDVPKDGSPATPPADSMAAAPEGNGEKASIPEPGPVDFVLAGPPSSPTADDGPEKEEPGIEQTSAFGDKGKDADALWASLSKDAPEAPEASAVPGAPSGMEPDSKGKKEKAAKQKPAKTRVPSAGPFGGKSFGPVVPARPMMLDEEGNLVPTPATLTSRLFTALALIPIILPIVLFLAQVVFTLDTRALWYSDEVRYASAYKSMVDSGEWLVMHLNGAVYPDKPPLFFWFLHGLDEAAKAILPLVPFSITVTQNMLFFAGVAISGLLCLLATHALASLVGRVDRRTVLAADLVLLSGFFFAAMAHYLRMDLLFAAFITFSHVFLFHAWVRDKAPLLMVLGYLCAGAAVLVKGPLGLAFPLLAGLCFLIWQGRFLRFFKLDSLFGLVVGLAVPGVWLALAWMNAGDDFLNNILHKQILARALDTWHHAEPWYHYLITFPLIWLPWTLILLFLPWGRFLNKGMRDGIKTSRTKDGAGIAYLWCAFLPGAVLLSLVSIKLPVYCLPLFPPLAILCARAVLQMRPFASSCLQYTLAIILAVLGLALVLMPAAPGNYLPIPFVPRGVMVLGGVCLFFACVLGFLIKPRRGEGSILILALFAVAFAYPAWTVTAPSLDAFLSPKAQAEVIATYRDAGYVPATYKVYPGTYTYYAGPMRDCASWEEALAETEKSPKMILALRASFWDNLENKPAGFAEVNRQTIAERDYVLVARPPLGGEKSPAEGQPEAPAPDQTPEMTPPSEAAPVPEASPALAASPAEPAGAAAPETPEAAPAAEPAAETPDTAVPASEGAAQPEQGAAAQEGFRGLFAQNILREQAHTMNTRLCPGRRRRVPPPLEVSCGSSCAPSRKRWRRPGTPLCPVFCRRWNRPGTASLCSGGISPNWRSWPWFPRPIPTALCAAGWTAPIRGISARAWKPLCGPKLLRFPANCCPWGKPWPFPPKTRPFPIL